MTSSLQSARPALSVNVFEYLDYRAFLRDAYDDLKARQRGFSYRWFSRKAGMSSPNFLKLVIDGQRNLTPKSVDKFAAALGLNTQESSFFSELVSFNQATTTTTPTASSIPTSATRPTCWRARPS